MIFNFAVARVLRRNDARVKITSYHRGGLDAALLLRSVKLVGSFETPFTLPWTPPVQVFSLPRSETFFTRLALAQWGDFYSFIRAYPRYRAMGTVRQSSTEYKIIRTGTFALKRAP